MRRAVVGLVGLLALLGLPACAPQDQDLPTLAELEARIRGDVDPSRPDPRHVEAQELLATCMAEAGFEYTPEVDPDGYVYSRPIVLTREFAEELGYAETIEPAPGVAPPRFAYLSAVPGQQENDAYRASLSPEASEAYWEAMHGAAPDGSAPGCQGTAFAEAFSSSTVPDAFRAAEQALEGTWLAAENHPEVVAALTRWSACMADAGFPGLEGELDAWRVVEARAEEFPAPTGLPYAQVREQFASELAELQAFEREVARTDVACREDVGFYPVWDRAKAEADAQVVATYLEDLEAWARWAEESRAGGS